MPGGLHIVFGIMIGLPIWAIANKSKINNDPSPTNLSSIRWSYSLLMVFVINNHFGPDFGGGVKALGELIQSEEIFIAGNIIHSYIGYILFAPAYSVLWYYIVRFLDQSRLRKNQNDTVSSEFFLNVPSYGQVYLCVLFGGFLHFFIDGIAHYVKYTDPPILRGTFNLFFISNCNWWVVFACIYLFLAGLYLRVLSVKAKSNQISLKVQFQQNLKNSQNGLILYGLGISIVNILILYFFLSFNNAMQSEMDFFPWNEISYYTIPFDFALLLSVTWNYPAGASGWILGIFIVMVLILFIWVYPRVQIVQIGKRKINAMHLFFILLFLSFLFLYSIQPWIGNISNKESDLGGFIFLWVTLGTTFMGFTLFNHLVK